MIFRKKKLCVHKRSSDSGKSMTLDRVRQRAWPNMFRGRCYFALYIRKHSVETKTGVLYKQGSC